MTINHRAGNAALLTFCFVVSSARARAELFELAASGTISSNSSGDATIPVGTPWSFELTYNTSAPDLDFELTTTPDPTFGRFTNEGSPPAMTRFHYKAGTYEVTLDDAGDFGAFSNIHITFTTVHAIDININAPSFPQLAGGPVSFHADFNAFSAAPIFANDGLPTNTALGPASFDVSSITLIPSTGVVTSSVVTSLTLTALPPSANFDGNENVDADDLARWKAGYGVGNARGQGDADVDGDVDGGDFLIWQRQLGTSPPSVGAAVATPEPAGAVLMVLAAMGLRRRGSARSSLD